MEALLNRRIPNGIYGGERGDLNSPTRLCWKLKSSCIDATTLVE